MWISRKEGTQRRRKQKMSIRISSGGKITPHYTRLMVFVDGTNLLVELFKELSIVQKEEKLAENPPLSSFELAITLIDNATGGFLLPSSSFITIRKYWFSSYVGGDEIQTKLRNALRNNGLEPRLFKKDRDKSEKGVDIALTKEMLVNAFNQNFDVALLIAGDEDYVELVNEVKRYGPVVNGAFLERGLSDNLRYALDCFQLITIDTANQKSLELLVSKISEEIKGR